ncbi:MAG: hypothetical protein ACJ72D_02750, partial [Marmoricola sp.]
RGRWILLGVNCRSDATATPTPAITPALVAHAFQRLPLPRLDVVVQPDAKTLVNLDTIFHTEASPLGRDVTLLGQRVQLAITPSRFRWVFGDGATLVTDNPGAAYPSRTITHRYLRADVTMVPHVEVSWTARYRVNGGAWADVPGTVLTIGPNTPLRVVEAVPNLSGTGH